MGDKRIAKNAKIVTLANGFEMPYCEFGEENEEVILSGAFYHHTFVPVLEALATRYHVYGFIMRMSEKDGPVTQRNSDGTVHWGRQWGEDCYQFAQALNIKKFHYVGKCHGTNPGWYLVKEHPEVLDTFSSLYLLPHLCPRDSNRWFEIMDEEGHLGSTKRSMRHQERVPIKMQELQSLSSLTGDWGVGQYAEAPDKMWDSPEELEAGLKAIKTPILGMFGTDDILFHDYYNSNLKAIETIPRLKTVLLQGERHLLEMDLPERMASEVMFFIDESRKNYD